MNNEEYANKKVPLSYAAIVAWFGGLDGRHRVIMLTDNSMEKTARLIQKDSMVFVKNIHVINLDEHGDYSAIYTLTPEDLLIVHIGIHSFIDKGYRDIFPSFAKPQGIAAKYIFIRPTITPQALLEGLNTPEETTEYILKKYSNLPSDKSVHVSAKSGTDITLMPYDPFIIPFVTHEPGANAYLPPAEISYSVQHGSARGVVVVDVTVGELRVLSDLVDPFGLVNEPITLHVGSGEIVDITGEKMAQRLKTELWKLPNSCRRIVELGIGLSCMTPSGIIGIDESIAGTCHFGIGNGSGNEAPIHLDVVVSEFMIDLF